MSSPIYIQQSGNMTPGHFASWAAVVAVVMAVVVVLLLLVVKVDYTVLEVAVVGILVREPHRLAVLDIKASLLSPTLPLPLPTPPISFSSSGRPPPRTTIKRLCFYHQPKRS